MNEMAQILGNLSKNSFKRKIWQTCPSAQCPFRQSVQSFHSFTHPSLRPSSPSLSACSLRLSALSVRPTVWQLSPLHPSTLYYLSIHSVHQSRPSSLSVCSVLPFVHPSVPLSVQFVCPSNSSANQLSGWQRERQKINTLRLAKHQFFTCIALFVHFFVAGAQFNLKLPYSRHFLGVNARERFSFLRGMT